MAQTRPGRYGAGRRPDPAGPSSPRSRFSPFDGSRGTEQVALAVGPAHGLHPLQLRRGLDALDHAGHAQAVDQMAQPDEQALAALVRVGAVDQASIELHAPNRQLVEHGEGAVAGAEVVDEDPHAVGVEALDVAAGRARQLEGHRLGDLEHEPGRIDVTGAEGGPHPFAEAGRRTVPSERFTDT